MIFLLVIISVAFSLICEFSSALIYFAIIRKKLKMIDDSTPLSWFPHKRREQINKYISSVKKKENDKNWGGIANWLSYGSWILLVIAALTLILFIWYETK